MANLQALCRIASGELEDAGIMTELTSICDWWDKGQGPSVLELHHILKREKHNIAHEKIIRRIFRDESRWGVIEPRVYTAIKNALDELEERIEANVTF